MWVLKQVRWIVAYFNKLSLPMNEESRVLMENYKAAFAPLVKGKFSTLQSGYFMLTRSAENNCKTCLSCAVCCSFHDSYVYSFHFTVGYRYFNVAFKRSKSIKVFQVFWF